MTPTVLAVCHSVGRLGMIDVGEREKGEGETVADLHGACESWGSVFVRRSGWQARLLRLFQSSALGSTRYRRLS